MIKALVACRAGVGSSLMLKIKLNEVIKENAFPIALEHSSLDGVPGFNGKYIITLPDVAEDLEKKIFHNVLSESKILWIKMK